VTGRALDAESVVSVVVKVAQAHLDTKTLAAYDALHGKTLCQRFIFIIIKAGSDSIHILALPIGLTTLNVEPSNAIHVIRLTARAYRLVHLHFVILIKIVGHFIGLNTRRRVCCAHVRWGGSGGGQRTPRCLVWCDILSLPSLGSGSGRADIGVMKEADWLAKVCGFLRTAVDVRWWVYISMDTMMLDGISCHHTTREDTRAKRGREDILRGAERDTCAGVHYVATPN